MGHEDAQVAVRHTVEVGGGDEPGTTHRIVHAQFTARIETGDPVLVGALRALDVAVSGTGRLIETDGHPAVVGQVRERGKKQGVDARTESAAEGVLVETTARAGDDQGIRGIAVAGAEQVGGVVGHHIQTVGGQSGQGTRGVGRDPVHIEPIAHGVIREGQARERVAGQPGGVPSSTGTGAVVAGAVVVGRRGIEVAGHGVVATTDFLLVTDAIRIGVVEAVAVAVKVIHTPSSERIEAASVIGIGAGVVVAGRRVRTTEVETGTVIRVGGGIIIGRRGIGTARVEAGTVVVVGGGIIVRGIRIRTSGIETGTIVDLGVGVVVAGRGIRTSGEDAGSIIEFGRSVVVRRIRIRTTTGTDHDAADHAEFGLVGHRGVVVVDAGNGKGERAQTGAFGRTEHRGNRKGLGVVERQSGQLVRRGVDVVQSTDIDPHDRGAHIEVQDSGVIVETAHHDHGIRLDATGVEVDATAVLIGGGGVVVPGGRIGTARDFLLVTDPVEVRIGETVAVTIAEGIGVDAAAVVVVGRGVKVARRGVNAAAVEAGAVILSRSGIVVVRIGVGAARSTGSVGAIEAQVEAEVRGAHPVLEDLHEQGSGNLAIRGELCQQDLEVVARHTIAVVLRHEPRATRGVVHDDVAARLEGRDPSLRRTLHRADLGLVHGRIRLLEDAHRHPAVVLKIGEEAEEQRVHRIRRGRTQRILIEGRGRGEVHREDGIATHGRNNVVRIHAIHVDAVGGLTGQQAGVMFDKDLYGEAIRGILSMRETRADKAKE